MTQLEAMTQMQAMGCPPKKRRSLSSLPLFERVRTLAVIALVLRTARVGLSMHLRPGRPG